MEALFKAAPPDDIGGDGRRESIAGEAEEILGRWKVEMQSGGHGKNGALGRMEARVGDESGVGGAGDARSAIEGDGITSVDGVDTLSECVAEGPDIASVGNVEGERVIFGGNCYAATEEYFRFLVIRLLGGSGCPVTKQFWFGCRLGVRIWALGGRVGKKVTVIFDPRPRKMWVLPWAEQGIMDGREDVHGAGIVQKRQPISRGESR